MKGGKAAMDREKMCYDFEREKRAKDREQKSSKFKSMIDVILSFAANLKK